MRYLGAQSQRCGILQTLRDRALALATTRGQPGGAVVDDGKVAWVSVRGPRDQFVLGNVLGSVLSSDEQHLAAVHVPTMAVGQRAEIGVFKLQKGARCGVRVDGVQRGPPYNGVLQCRLCVEM